MNFWYDLLLDISCASQQQNFEQTCRIDGSSTLSGGDRGLDGSSKGLLSSHIMELGEGSIGGGLPMVNIVIFPNSAGVSLTCFGL